MDPRKAAQLIATAGGDIAFARLLGLDVTESLQQRVNNWKRRGLPHKIVAEHYEKLKELERQAGICGIGRGSGSGCASALSR